MERDWFLLFLSIDLIEFNPSSKSEKQLQTLSSAQVYGKNLKQTT